MITALGFMLFNLGSYFLAYKRGPFWGLFAYMNVYLNPPNPLINWWADYLPFDRWSLLTSFILLTSMFMHKDKWSDHKFSNTRWPYIFFALSFVVTITSALDKPSAYDFLYIIFTYCMIVYIMLRTIRDEQQMRLFLITIVAFTGYVSINAYLYGRRVNDRLEMIGAADAYGSNEFSLLLASIIPLVFVFLKNGTRNERLIAFGSFPFILNAFILCNSRGSTVAFVGGIIVAVVLVADKRIRKAMLVLTIAMIPPLVYLADAAYIERFTTLIGFSDAMEDESAANTLSSGRTEIWSYGIEMAKDHPFGVGPEGFKKLAHIYMPAEVLTFDKGSDKGRRSAHNTYLQVYVEQGAIGLIIWLGLCLHNCFILRKSFKLISKLRESRPFWKDTIFALNIASLSTIIGGLVNSRIYYEFFWWQLAMTAIIYSLVCTMEKNEEENLKELKSLSVESDKLENSPLTLS